MKKMISLFLIAIMVCSMSISIFATTDYTNGTLVEYVGKGTDDYNITVPAKLAPGKSGTVTLSGTWASDKTIKVTADKTVTLINSINANDQKVLNVTFAGIEKAGNNTEAKTYTETVSVDEMPTSALFGTWDGKFNYNVEMCASKSQISVSATDKNGNDLNAESFVITGQEKDDLLNQLKQTDLVDDNAEIDALIEVKSDEFDDLADTTFDVSSIAQPGDKVVILHFNEETREWEYISEEIVDADGKVNADFSSYSPIAFVVVKPDGTIIPIGGEVVHFNTWYRCLDEGVSIALMENGICFVETVDMIAGMQVNVVIEDGKIYSNGQVMGEIVDANTIKAYNMATNDYAAGYITYTCDPALDEKITSYVTIDLPDNFMLAHINNEYTTWEAFINSKYNRMLTTVTSGDEYIEIRHKAFIDLNGYLYYDVDGIAPVKYNGQKVKTTDVIISGANYLCDGPEADATNKSFLVGEYDMFHYMPGMTWGEWLNTTYNGHYGMVMYADENGYVTYQDKQIYPEGQPEKLAHCDDVIIECDTYLFVN